MTHFPYTRTCFRCGKRGPVAGGRVIKGKFYCAGCARRG